MNDLDPDIVKRAQAGDEQASRSVIEALHRPVFATVYRFLGPRFRTEIEDVAQDVFLKVFRAIGRYDPERGVKFTTWVYTFVRNHCFDVLKKRRLVTLSLADGRRSGARHGGGDGPREDAPATSKIARSWSRHARQRTPSSASRSSKRS